MCFSTIKCAFGDIGNAYDCEMKFGATVLYVDHVQLVVDFYQRAFGLKLRFHDEQLGFAELDTGGPVIAIADHSLGEMLMPGAGGYRLRQMAGPRVSRSVS